ncbi:MAG: hydrogenase nickel incorporation protein HypB [Firmicutes bacterium]|nr:hydrogenase nickel incorporation protein HypB [Bacillota bacterium]MBQ9604050.1 hydrogenase nickel incorporation protein HypB [Bacillota bacterium]
MSEVKIIDLKANVMDDNNILAANTRARLKAEKTFLLNLMSAPGSGKTTTLSALIPLLKDKYRIGVMEADIDSDVDAIRIKQAGAESIQLHTGGMCHLDADMTTQGLDSFGSADFDLIILENVGNLVCPAEFDTGASKNAMILSVPEGDDKPLKYPLMFQTADVVIINKTDTLPYFDFDMEKAEKNIHMRHPGIDIIPVCAKTGEGMDKLAAWIEKEVEEWKNN